MTREETTQYLRGLTGGCAVRVLDGVLYACYLIAAVASQPRSAGGARRAGHIADALFERCNASTVRSWITRLRARGWIGKHLRVTVEGQRRLAGILPSVRWHQPWDGRWYLVSFDVPETLHHRRDALRAGLQRLGFGKLHASLWVSPWDVLGDVQDIVRRQHLDVGGSVLVAMSPRLGTQEAQELADRVWPLAERNAQYRAFVRERGRGHDDPMHIGELLSILRDDPQLPKALLPQPWYGFAAIRYLRRVGGPLFDGKLQKRYTAV